jgi:glutamate synthase domain-containing protein 1
MVAIPHEFFKRVVREACGVRLQAAGEYAVMMAFLPKEPEQYHSAKGTIAKCAQT